MLVSNHYKKYFFDRSNLNESRQFAKAYNAETRGKAEGEAFAGLAQTYGLHDLRIANLNGASDGT